MATCPGPQDQAAEAIEDGSDPRRIDRAVEVDVSSSRDNPEPSRHGGGRRFPAGCSKSGSRAAIYAFPPLPSGPRRSVVGPRFLRIGTIGTRSAVPSPLSPDSFEGLPWRGISGNAERPHQRRVWPPGGEMVRDACGRAPCWSPRKETASVPQLFRGALRKPRPPRWRDASKRPPLVRPSRSED
jgi:hypothetical protein